jgi:hypothetical protein
LKRVHFIRYALFIQAGMQDQVLRCSAGFGHSVFRGSDRSYSRVPREIPADECRYQQRRESNQ